MTPAEKAALKNTSEENLIMFHTSLTLQIRNEFGMWTGNGELI